jgi:hypothetical protein
MFLRRAALVLAGLLLFASPSLAQPPSLTPAQVRQALTEVKTQTKAHYFNAAKRDEVIAAIEAGERSGRYEVANAAELATRLTEDLGKSSGDRHMYINWNPQLREAVAAAAGAGRESDDTDLNRRTSLARNHGLTQMRVLPGNIRYLRIEAFLWDGEASKKAYDDAMRFLGGGSAAVIDIRGNGGGSPEAINYLTSHFVDPNTLLMRFVFAGREDKSVSQGRLPAGSLKGKPLYVLIDGGVGSASEEFAMHVAKFRLGQLVGQKTAGAGNRNELYPVSPGFVLSLSVGAALHGTDGKGWEAVGIAPTMAVEPSLALEKAQVSALNQLAAKAAGDEARSYAWAIEALNSKIQPVSLAADALRPYPGQFGERSVKLGDRGLIYQRAGGPAVPLTPMGGDLFQFGPDDSGVRVRFERSAGGVGRMTVLYENGQAQTYERTS